MAGQSKALPSPQVVLIRQLHSLGMRPGELAIRFKRSRKVINQVVNGHTYRYVRPELLDVLAEADETSSP